MRRLSAKRLRQLRRIRDSHRADINACKAQVQDHLALLVGKLAIAWALMEMNLDRAIEIFHRNGGADAIQSDLPVSMKSKLKYLRKARALLEEKWHSKVEALCDDTRELKRVRSDLMHGVAGEFHTERKGWVFSRSDFDKATRAEVLSERSFEAIAKAILDVVKLNNRMSVLVLLVADQFDPKNARNRNR